MKLIAADAGAASAGGQKHLQLAPDADLGALAAEGAFAVDRVELEFPKFNDGRAFSQAVELRRRHGFAGDVRAIGDVRVDQLVQMERCGFSSAVLAPGQSIETARRQFARFHDFYQGDAIEPAPHFARAQAMAAARADGAAVREAAP